MRRPALYEDLEGVPVAKVAAALGMRAGRSGFGPCPCCGAERRGREDTRPPLRIFKAGTRWKCSTCDEGGDAAALVLAVAMGSTKAGADGWAAARELAELRGLTRAEVGADGARRPSGGARGRVGPAVAPAAVPDASARTLPPAGEVAALWATCGPVSRCADAVAWLEGRGLDPVAVEALDLARVCPAATWHGWSSTTWAKVGRRSWGAGWRIVLPAFNPAGQLVTFRARWALEGRPPIGSKEIAPAGHLAGPALYADRGARALLEGTGGAALLVVVEGGPAWLRYAIEAAGRPSGAVAVVGLFAGGWSSTHADRLAAARRWTVATDDDEAGDRYAAAVLADAERCNVDAQRWRAGR